MRRRALLALALAWLAIMPSSSGAQSLKRIGVVVQGGPYYYSGIEGLRDGLKGLGLEEGRDIALIVRDAKGDLIAVQAAASGLERDGVDLIVTFATSVTLASKRATTSVPIVFVAGSDPVAMGLVESVARPGGRATGVYSIVTDLTPKRLELLRELVPTVRRILTFYNPGNPAAAASAQLAREAARRLGIDLVERHVTTTQQLSEQVSGIAAPDADACFFVADAMVLSQDSVVLERANALRMPTMATYVDPVARGALAGYGTNYRELGRQAAAYVGRILSGTAPGDLPVEAINRPTLAVNLKTAAAIGVAVPPSLLARADEVIE
jgi:putative tryptophan/tyrosine transport system substrate-binding protein